MAVLLKDWLTEGVFDLEYKKYKMLAYLQHIDRQFSAYRLFPHLPELQDHLKSCQQILLEQKTLKRSFPKNVIGVDRQNWQLLYEDQFHDAHFIGDLNEILDFAIHGFTGLVGEGVERVSEIEEDIRISPVGIIPLHLEEGYLFFCHGFDDLLSVFSYRVALYNQNKERSINTTYIESIKLGYERTIGQVKIDLSKRYKSLPNPATYVIESRRGYPLHETLLPVAKRLMMKYVNVA